MADPKDPAKSTGIQKSAPTAPRTAITAAVPSQTSRPALQQTLDRRLSHLDKVLLGIVLILAFFLGCFPAANSDILLHLGLGSPFGAGADQSGWPHHAWLPSLILGAIYQPFSSGAELGGQIAVVLKALVVVGLAVVLTCIRRRGQTWLLPVLFAGLAVLVMSPRLLLQPFVLSLLFLAVTFLILTLPSATYPRAVWWLPALFFLWVNCDQWFILGPLTVAVFLLGEWLERRLDVPATADIAAEPQRLKHLGLALLAGLGACLINPWTYRAFSLPWELSDLIAGLGKGLPDFLVGEGRTVHEVFSSDAANSLQRSPLSSDYFSRPASGQNVAGLAYFLLLGLGIASFVVPAFFLKPASMLGPAHQAGRRGITLPLFTVFVFFGLLSMLTTRLIPVFAVLAGPICAINFEDYLRRRRAAGAAAGPHAQNWAVGMRLAGLVAALALAVCAWPGWLHAAPDDWRVSRHVGASVAEDSGVVQAAEVITNIQQYGRAHGQLDLLKQGVCFDINGGNGFVWSNHHRGTTANLFTDARFGLYSGAPAEALGKIRRGLLDEILPKGGMLDQSAILKARAAYQEAMRVNHIDHLVFTNLHRDITQSAMVERLQQDRFTFEWVVLYNDGRTAVLGWLDLKKTSDPFAQVRMDLVPLTPPATFPPNTPTINLKPGIPAVPTEAVSEWEIFLTGPARPGLSSFQSAACYQRFMSASQQARNAFQNMAAQAGGPAALGSRQTSGGFDVARDQGPPGAVPLAIRAARNGILESPDHWLSYKILASSCEPALEQENRWSNVRMLPAEFYKPILLRDKARFITILTALHTAATLNPGDAEVHVALANLYYRFNFFDLFAEEFKQAADLDSKLAGQRLDLKQLPKLLEEVKKRQDEYKQASTGQGAMVRFDIAMYVKIPDPKDPQAPPQQGPRGLVGTGLKILQEANVNSLDGDSLRRLRSWQLYLLLMTGKAHEVRDILTHTEIANAMRKLMPAGEFDEYQALAAAALGDYAAADKHLAEAEKAQDLPSDLELAKTDKQLMQNLLTIVATRTAWLQPGDDGIGGLASRLGAPELQLFELGKDQQKLIDRRVSAAQARVARGLFALETGNLTEAATHFQASLRLAPPLVPFPDRGVAQRYLELLDGGKR
jgi:tetratricopeptide (TPR) repeat protein